MKCFEEELFMSFDKQFFEFGYNIFGKNAKTTNRKELCSSFTGYLVLIYV